METQLLRLRSSDLEGILEQLVVAYRTEVSPIGRSGMTRKVKRWSDRISKLDPSLGQTTEWTSVMGRSALRHPMR